MAARLHRTVAVLAFGLLAALAGGVGAEPTRKVVVSPVDLLRLASQLAKNGNANDAEDILDLLAKDPDSDIRNEARFRHSKMLEQQGRTTSAALLLRQIIAEKPSAAPVRLELAAVLAKLGDNDGAWRQLRAAQAAGLPPAVARLVDRYSEALRARRPAGFTIDLAIAPDSNINRATRSDTLGTVFGDFDIDRAGKAKSGIGLAVDAQAYRRFDLSRGGSGDALLVRAGGLANLYRVSKFNELILDIAGGPELQLGATRLDLEAGVSQRWFGQKPFSRSARVGATVARPLGARSMVRLTGSAALVDNRLNDLQDGRDYTLGVSFEHALSPTTGVVVNVSGQREALKDPGYSTIGWRAGLSGWRDLGRVTVTGGMEFGRLHADERLLLFPERREDRFSQLSFGATFRQLQVGGFAPAARLTIERNRSTIAFYDYRRVRTEFGIVRAF